MLLSSPGKVHFSTSEFVYLFLTHVQTRTKCDMCVGGGGVI